MTGLIISLVQQACSSSFHGSRDPSIDEAKIGFKGSSSVKQHMPKKPTKKGFKVWVRSDSNSGYVCQMNFYTGKQEGGATEVGLGSKVVTRLTRDLVGRNHSVYKHNFSSIDLFQNLLTDKIYATGTLCSNHRGFPADLTTVAKRGLPSRGNYECRQK